MASRLAGGGGGNGSGKLNRRSWLSKLVEAAWLRSRKRATARGGLRRKHPIVQCSADWLKPWLLGCLANACRCTRRHAGFQFRSPSPRHATSRARDAVRVRESQNQRCLRELRVVQSQDSRRHMEQSSGVVDYRSVRYILMVDTISTMAELVE